MRKILPILIMSFIWISCDKKNEDSPIQNMPVNDTTETPTENKGKIRFLALGDSYTIGQSVEIDERWPVQLVKALKPDGYDTVELEIIARTGWTTSELAGGIEDEDPQGPYDLVGLLIGVNNQYRGQNPETYRIEFNELLQQAIGFAGNSKDRVIVVSIPDYSVTPFAARLDTAKIADEIDLFNAINKTETLEAEVEYVNVTPISRAAKYNPDLIASDGLHPSGLMYTQWVELIHPVALEILENNNGD
jgi:lysophospholipase L1-like esterase